MERADVLTLEQASATGDHRGRAADPQPRALVQRQHGAVVLLEELRDPLVPRLAHEGRGRVGVDVVEVDLERHQPERGEARRPADRHVVGGADGRAGDVRAGGGADVAGRALAHARAELLDHAETVEGVEQPERVAAAHHHDLCLEDRPVRGAGAVRGHGLDAERSERRDGPVGVVVPVGERVRDERHHAAGRDAGEGLGGVREHAAAVVGGVREQEQLHGRQSGRPALEAMAGKLLPGPRVSTASAAGRGLRNAGAGCRARRGRRAPGRPCGPPGASCPRRRPRARSPAWPRSCPSGRCLP